jgi:hypothetical protein
MAVTAGGHIEVTMVPMPVSLADPNSDAADPDIGAFGDDYWFVATGQRTGKRWHRQERTRKKANATFFMALSFFGTNSAPLLVRVLAWYS